MSAPLTLVITLFENAVETDSGTTPAGRIGCSSADVDKSREAATLLREQMHDAARGILVALEHGCGPSHAARILDTMDRAALRELGFDSVALVVKL